MREKLLDLMKNEGLKPSQLADMLGINPAGISHILAGRNKPGFDLLQKMLRRFPRISPDWLLLDEGPMYRNSETPEAGPGSGGTAAGSRSETPTQNFEPGELFAPTPSRQPETADAGTPTSATVIEPRADAATSKPSVRAGNRPAAVKRIVVLYEDETFEAYFPSVR